MVGRQLRAGHSSAALQTASCPDEQWPRSSLPEAAAQTAHSHFHGRQPSLEGGGGMMTHRLNCHQCSLYLSMSALLSRLCCAMGSATEDRLAKHRVSTLAIRQSWLLCSGSRRGEGRHRSSTATAHPVWSRSGQARRCRPHSSDETAMEESTQWNKYSLQEVKDKEICIIKHTLCISNVLT